MFLRTNQKVTIQPANFVRLFFRLNNNSLKVLGGLEHERKARV